MLEQIKNTGIEGLTVLVIEDDITMQNMLRDILQTLGFRKILIAGNGTKAIESFSHTQVDFIICDWRLPGMSGIEFTKYIRNLPALYNKFVDIIMLTGNVELQNIIEARNAGVTEYIIKPFKVRDLCNRIIEIIEKPREFILANDFKGPSRRRREKQVPIADRRKNKQKLTKRNKK